MDVDAQNCLKELTKNMQGTPEFYSHVSLDKSQSIWGKNKVNGIFLSFHFTYARK